LPRSVGVFIALKIGHDLMEKQTEEKFSSQGDIETNMNANKKTANFVPIIWGQKPIPNNVGCADAGLRTP